MGALPDVDVAKIKRYCENDTPPEFRDQMRLEAGVRGRSVTIFECRPPWPDDGSEWTRQPIGQLRYDAGSATWSLYWADRNDRWHLYDLIEPGSVEAMLAEIQQDPTCIFWG